MVRDDEENDCLITRRRAVNSVRGPSLSVFYQAMALSQYQ